MREACIATACQSIVGATHWTLVRQVYVTGSVQGEWAGSLVGWLKYESTLEDSYSRASADWSSQGGLFSHWIYNDSLLRRSYYAAEGSAARMYQDMGEGSSTNAAFFDCDIAGDCTSAGATSTSDLQSQSFLSTAGWDMDTVWALSSADGYACLRWQPGCGASPDAGVDAGMDAGEVCTPSGPDDNCNGVDDDCDGTVDEGYASQSTSCGVGACGRTGSTTCSGGTVTNSCQPGAPAASDTTCDGVDDDCNGVSDEDYPAQATECGVGACLAIGAISCVGGTIVNSCQPGTAASSDSTCNGVDDDCDGQIDEDYVPPPTTCGFGLCASQGTLTCVSGAFVDTCTVGGQSSVICPAPDTCHDVGTCDLNTGACANPTRPNGSGCSNGNACDGPDLCQAGVCTAGALLEVDDLNPCTADACDAVAGVTHTPSVGASCDDANACNGADTCNAAGQCQSAVPDGTLCCGAEVLTDPLASAIIDPTIITTFPSAVAPLYIGSGASQKDVATNAISPEKVAVIKGMALNEAGTPLSCAEVSVPGFPQYGTTKTRPDGSFAIAVNGGTSITVQVKLPGFITASRRVDTHWNEYAFVSEIRLLARSPAQPVSASASTITVVTGESETDVTGTRQATLLFKPGTSATVAGESTPRTEYAVSIKEMTNLNKVGRNGMPASLPPQSAFTYAVSLDLAGAEDQDVTFSNPIAAYVENFIGFPIGTNVPVGRFDRRSQQWVVPSRVERVIPASIVSRCVRGMAG